MQERGYSDVYTAAGGEYFDLVVVVPTGAAKTEIAAYGRATSGQYQPDGGEPWPGKPDRYRVRIDVEDVRFTTRDAVRSAVQAAGRTWAAQWTVLALDLDENMLSAPSTDPEGVRERSESYELPLPGDETEEPDYVEGAVKQVVVNAYERNAAARKKCIDTFGPVCVVCGFDFGAEYGRVGRGFIHVHHLVPLHSVGKEYVVDPLNDLRPVCPNCHAIIHKRNPPYSIEEVQEMMDSQRNV